MTDNGNLGTKIKIKHFEHILKSRVTECKRTDQETESGLSELRSMAKNGNWLTRNLFVCLH